MRTDVAQGAQVLRQVRGFLVVTHITPELGVIVKHVETLDELIERLTAGGVSQERSDRAYHAAASAARAQARRLYRTYLQPVAGLGKRLFKHEPMLFRTLAMPGGRGYERLITVANALADEAEARQEQFVAAGFGEHFADRLRQAALVLRQLIDAKGAHLGHRSAATLGMVQDLAAGRELVRFLDRMVRPWLEDHAPGQVAEWKTLTRFVRAAAPVVEGPETGEDGAPANPEGHAA